MNDPMQIEITLFGPFRKYGAHLTVNAPSDSTVTTLRPLLIEEFRRMHPTFNEDELVGESALADDEEILTEGSRLSKRLSLLPPVCGG